MIGSSCETVSCLLLDYGWIICIFELYLKLYRFIKVVQSFHSKVSLDFLFGKLQKKWIMKSMGFGKYFIFFYFWDIEMYELYYRRYLFWQIFYYGTKCTGMLKS